ncbi:MAG TPA: hypothetical protein VNA13_02040 [Xanthomonadales bacterium]|nr:hypothetical protein [Xanthomonadales bacterium]
MDAPENFDGIDSQISRSSTQPQDESGTANPEVEQAVEEMFEAVGMAKEAILEGKWSSILGADASGRYPALIMGHLMKRVYKEKGINQPKQFFYAGGQQMEKREELLMEYFQKIKPELGDRALIVTESIHSGKELHDTLRMFRKLGIAADVLSINSDLYVNLHKHAISENQDYREQGYKSTFSFYEGEVDLEREYPEVNFYLAKGNLYGDAVGKGSRAQGTGIKGRYDKTKATSELNPDRSTEEINALRSDARTVADKLYAQVFAPNPQT